MNKVMIIATMVMVIWDIKAKVSRSGSMCVALPSRVRDVARVIGSARSAHDWLPLAGGGSECQLPDEAPRAFLSQSAERGLFGSWCFRGSSKYWNL